MFSTSEFAINTCPCAPKDFTVRDIYVLIRGEGKKLRRADREHINGFFFFCKETDFMKAWLQGLSVFMFHDQGVIFLTTAEAPWSYS